MTDEDPLAGATAAVSDAPESADAAARRLRREKRRARLSILPTMLTLGNLVCGVLAIAKLADAQALFALSEVSGESAAALAEAGGIVEMAGWLILGGMVCDVLDGRVARLTRTSTNFGGMLDSLADLVTFGVAPALTAKLLMSETLGMGHERMTFLTAVFFVLCAALRLARYTAEHDEPDDAVAGFSGLPTPGAAGVVAGIALCHQDLLGWWDPSISSRTTLAYVVGFGLLTVLGVLMVSRVPYAHLGNRFLGGRRPVGKVALLILVVMLVANLPLVWVLAGGFLVYAFAGPVAMLPRLLRGRPSDVPELFD